MVLATDIHAAQLPAVSSKTEWRRQQVTKLHLVEKRPLSQVAKRLGVSVKTIRNDVQIIRNQNRADLATGEHGQIAESLLLDSLSSTDARIRALYKKVKNLEDHEDAILMALRPQNEDDFVAGYAKALETYTKTYIRLNKELREEEAHKAKMLKEFGVIHQEETVNQNVTVRDETPLIQALANIVNQELRDNPNARQRIRQSLTERLKITAGQTNC